MPGVRLSRWARSSRKRSVLKYFLLSSGKDGGDDGVCTQFFLDHQSTDEICARGDATPRPRSAASFCGIRIASPSWTLTTESRVSSRRIEGINSSEIPECDSEPCVRLRVSAIHGLRTFTANRF